MDALNPVLVGFTVCLAIAFLFSEFFHSKRYPRVLGYILAGILFGSPYVRGALPGEIFPILESLSEIGIVFFLLCAGTEIDLSKLKKISTSALILGTTSFFIPFFAGLAIMITLGYSILVSFVVALCISVTAAAIAVEVLMEYDLLNSKAGALIVWAGMVDDLLGVFFLSFMLAFIKIDGPLTLSVLYILSRLYLEFLAFCAIAYLIGLKLYPKIVEKISRTKSEAGVFTLSIVFGMFITILSQFFGLSALVGAFIAGIIINLTIKSSSTGREIIHSLNTITFGLIIPFFFISIGLKFAFSSLFYNIPLLLTLILIGFFGKYAGVYVSGFVCKLKKEIVDTVGLGMNDRGGIELIIAMIALSNGLIDKSIFSVIVSMSFITTFVSLILFRRQVRINQKGIGEMIDDAFSNINYKPHGLQVIKKQKDC